MRCEQRQHAHKMTKQEHDNRFRNKNKENNGDSMKLWLLFDYLNFNNNFRSTIIK